MTVFGAVVQPLMRAVLEAGRQFPFRCAVRAEFIRYNAFGQAVTLNQYPQQALGRPFVASALQDLIQNDPLLIDRPPEPEYPT